MRNCCFRFLWLVLVAAFVFVPRLPAQEGGTGAIILDTAGFWRCYYTIKPPVVKKEEKVEKLIFAPRGRETKWLMHGTPLPAEDWAKPDFDDSAWSRFPGVLSVARRSREKSPFVALVCMRGRFKVTDPAGVKGLTLSASYRGGIVVYLNGKEIARGHLPKGGGFEQLAEDYPFEEYDPKHPEKKSRSLANIQLPDGILRKGVNVLAVEVHRAAYGEKDIKMTGRRKDQAEITWGNCGLVSVRLEAAGSGGVVPNIARPREFQVWNSNPVQVDCDMDYGDPNEKLAPICLVGTRNGAFSGKVVVGSSQPIKGLSAKMSDLKLKNGGIIPASAVQIRYAKPDWHQVGIDHRYLVLPACFSSLEEYPPAEVQVPAKKSRRWWTRCIESPGVSPSYGAVVPVWVTINVPKDAKPGDYEGRLTITAAGIKPVSVPVRLKVCGWKLPDPHDFVTWVDIIQSPESVALQYNVPLWSDEHFKYLEKSLMLLGQVGNKAAYIHLICHTNAGNAETMVRWIKQGDGSYKHDFTPMEKYIELVAKYLGKPEVACLYVHDYYCNKGSFQEYANRPANRHASGEVFVTALGPDGKTEMITLPSYDDPKSRELWKPVIDGVRQRLKKHGLKNMMMFGVSSDFRVSKFIVSFFKEISPGTPWVNQGHGSPTDFQGVPCSYGTDVWRSKFIGSGEKYGWRRPDPAQLSRISWSKRTDRAHHPRNPLWNFPVTSYRLIGELCIGGNRFGFARLGADFWKVIEDKRGRKRILAARYPKSSWRNIDIRSCVFSAGKNGAISSQRFELSRCTSPCRPIPVDVVG